MSTSANLSAFIWSVADLLRGDYKQSDYGKVILPFTVLRRLDCVLESTKKAVLKEFADKQNAEATARAADTNWIDKIESPPNAKNDSTTDTRSKPTNPPTIRANTTSASPDGAT